MGDYLTKRGDVYYYKRRVPIELAAYDPRPFVRISLKTTDRREAQRKADIHNQHMEEFWRTLVAAGGYSDDAWKKAVAMARLHGFTYKTAADVATLPLAEILDRLAAAKGKDADMVAALLGGIDHPEILLSTMLDRYWPLCVDRLTKKSDHQKHKWKVPREAAFNLFIQEIGNKPLEEITKKDVLAFREFWGRRIAEEKKSPDTGNKQLRFVQDILQTVADGSGLEMDFRAMFARTAFLRDHESRPPFESEWIQKNLLAAGALDGMNKDNQLTIYAIADTGARISEIIGLEKSDIFLDDPIPHIWIRAAEERALKTRHSERKIPLVGAALYAFKQRPDGFQRYSTADSASAAINKFLRGHGLLPTEKHSLYSLRHTFKDRLRDAGAPEEVIDQLMGHETNRPKYGRGHILETKQKWMKKIAFTMP